MFVAHQGAGDGNRGTAAAVGAGVGIDGLARWLDAAGVPDGVVVVGEGAAAPDAVWRIRAVTQDQEGGPAWEVFWSESGRRSAWVRFDDEATACFALLGRLVWTRLARGPLPGAGT